ncbi:MAG: anthranilate phosphoribosyltransferase, partial [Phycisphaerales bacterium]|nr:anthranilate phosphoribosyltransferase [Phycisphaerales bacterium]
MPSLGDIFKALPTAPLSEPDAEFLFDSMFGGQLDQAQIAGVLALMAARGPTPDEVVGAARAMRRHVTPIPARHPESIIDTCGTGGAPKTFNVSTAAAIVAAGAGARVAKHGNRSRTGRGSAEVLAALGVNVDASPEVQARCLDEAGVCFCFAIHHHPATRHATPVRKALKFPTIFNVLGPLTNPARASRQVIGVYDEGLVPLMAQALARLGCVRAMVAHSRDGLDEVSITAPTLVATVADGRLSMDELDPRPLVPHLDLAAIDRSQLVAADTEAA